MKSFHLLTVSFLLVAFSAQADVTVVVESADGTKGSVSGGGTYAEGAPVTLVATPADGFGFTRWEGDVPSAVRFDATATFVPSGDVTARAVFGRVLYVATTGNNNPIDGTNPATPYKTIGAAIAAAVADDSVSVGPGSYAESFTVSKAISVRGAGMALTGVTKNYIKLDNANCLVADLYTRDYNGQGALYFTANGGTAVRCSVSGSTRTTTYGTGVYIASGALIGCSVTNNWNTGAGGTVGIHVYANAGGGEILIENCLVAQNYAAEKKGNGGVSIMGAGGDVIIRNTTITDNQGADAGGIIMDTESRNLVVENSIIAENCRLGGASTSASDDLSVKGKANYSRMFRNCLIGRKPTGVLSFVTFENCLFDVSPNFRAAAEKDWSTPFGAPALGCFPDPAPAGFDVGFWATTNECLAPLVTTLVATNVHAPDDSVTYDWDFDGDGVFEKSGQMVEQTFTKVGANRVVLRATSGGATVVRTNDWTVTVVPHELFVWQGSPTPTPPYATWATAAHEPYAAMKSACDGCRISFTNETVTMSYPRRLRIFKNVEFAGVSPHSGGTLLKSAQERLSTVELLSPCVFHSMAVAVGNPVMTLCDASAIVSNCVLHSGEFTTTGNARGLYATAGLATHCIISNNTTRSVGGKGSAVYLSGGATLRNSLVTKNTDDSTSGTGCLGAVYVDKDGCLENCTVVDNKTGTGGGVYVAGKGAIVNNIIYGNVATRDATLGEPDWFVASAGAECVFSNNCMSVKKHESDLAADPTFTNTVTYTFGPGSPCAGKGLFLDWMTEGATSLWGTPRVTGGVVDIGAAQVDRSEVTCSIRAEPNTGFKSVSVTLTADVSGTTLPDDAEYLWYFGGSGMPDATGKTVVHVFGPGEYAIRLVVKVGDETKFDVLTEKVVTVYPETIYVNAANETPVYPYDEPSKASKTFDEAFALARDGATVVVSPGDYPVYREIVVSGAVTIRSDGSGRSPRLVHMTSTGPTFVQVSHPSALLEGLVLDDQKLSLHCLAVSGPGTIRDCEIINATYTVGSGIGVAMSDGLLDGCIISNNTANGGVVSDAGGAFLQLTGNAVVRNCLVTKNWVNSDDRPGGVILVGGDAVLESCTVVGNKAGKYSAVMMVDGGTVRNCLIGTNTVSGPVFAGASPYWPSLAAYSGGILDFSAVKFADYNCYTSHTATVFGAHDRLLGDTRFKNAEAGDFTVRTTSPAYHAGLVLDWMTSEAVDILGRPRLWHGKVDIGAYQCQRDSGLLILVE